MILETFPVGILRCNCTILGDETTREAIVVDPGEDVPEILTRLATHKLTLKQIIITHGHIDHVGGAVEAQARHRRSNFSEPVRPAPAGNDGGAGRMARR